jgi:hypothetical protein
VTAAAQWTRWTHLDQMVGEGQIEGARCPSGPSAQQAIASPNKGNNNGDRRKPEDDEERDEH